MPNLDYLERLIVGCWQLAAGHGQIRQSASLEVLTAYYDAGFRVFDCADIYTGVEELLGSFVAAHGLAAGELKIHTKYVPDLSSLPTLSQDEITRAIDRSLTRLGVERLELVQFHWWDYRVPGYLEALDALAALRREGKIKEIGLTNFDAQRTEEILTQGIPIASLQTQYSLLDRRPQRQLAALAREHAVPLLCYGSVAGGLLSGRYLGAPPPGTPENRSLVKYLLILEEMGGWQSLQVILQVLNEIATERDTDIATVACSYCLSREAVAACIVGVRNQKHLERHRELRDGFALSQHEIDRIELVRCAFTEIPGRVYELERDREGRHGRIMKYDLNRYSA